MLEVVVQCHEGRRCGQAHSDAVDHRVGAQDVGHAGRRRGQGQAQAAQQRPRDGHLPVGELLQQGTHEQAGEVHAHVQGTDDDGRSSRPHLQLLEGVAEQEAEGGLYGSGGQLEGEWDYSIMKL